MINTGTPQAVPVGQQVSKQGSTRLQNDINRAKQSSMGQGSAADAARTSLKGKLPNSNRSSVRPALLASQQGTARPQLTPQEFGDLGDNTELPMFDQGPDPLANITTNIKLEELLSSIPMQNNHMKNQLSDYFYKKNQQRQESEQALLASNVLGRLLHP